MDISGYIKNNTLHVIVKANSNKNEIVEWDEDRQVLKIAVKGKPEKGKANLELIKFIRKLSGRQVGISHGLTSRDKILEFF